MKLIHANRIVALKFTISGVLHQGTVLVAPLGNNQMILGMPWLERVNPDIDWKLRTVSLRIPKAIVGIQCDPVADVRKNTKVDDVPSIETHDDAMSARPCPPMSCVPTTPDAVAKVLPKPKMVRMVGPCAPGPYHRPTHRPQCSPSVHDQANRERRYSFARF